MDRRNTIPTDTVLEWHQIQCRLATTESLSHTLRTVIRVDKRRVLDNLHTIDHLTMSNEYTLNAASNFRIYKLTFSH